MSEKTSKISKEHESIHLACETMGVFLSSYDRFITDALDWLCLRVPYLRIERIEGEGWHIECEIASLIDENLAGAVAGAIHAVKGVDENEQKA